MRTLLAAILMIIMLSAVGIGAQEFPAQPPPIPTQSPAAMTDGAGDEGDDPAPVEPGALARRAVLMVAGWQTESATTFFAENGERFADTIDHAVVVGLIQAQIGETSRALETLSAASAAAPDDPVPHYYRGEVLYWQRRYDEAKQAWSAAAQRARTDVTRFEAADPTPTPAPSESASKSAPPGVESTEATAAVETILDPERARAEYYLGAALNRQHKYTTARKILVRALENGFDPVLTNHQIALGYLYDKQWEPARLAFDTVIEADPLFAPAYYYRGMAWDKLGRKDNLLIDMDAFLSLAPNAPEAGRARSILAASRR